MFTAHVHQIGPGGRLHYLGLHYRSADIQQAERDAQHGIAYAARHFDVPAAELCAQIVDRHGHHRSTIAGSSAA